MSEELRENKMGTMPVRRLVLSMSLPMMIAMLVQALYNVVDSYFVAKLSENALTAVGMVFPFQNLMIAVGVGTGVGVNAFLSRSLGEKNYDAANRAAENGVFLAVLSTLVFTVAGLTLAHPFIAVQTDIPDIVSSGTAYMRICGGLSFGLFLEIMFERLLQATGRTFYTMLTQGTGAIINIIMDPVLIFGLGPFPRMEVAGAAAATVLGQIVAAVLAVLFNLTCNHDIHPTLRGFRPNGPVIRNIYSVGAPSIILNSIGSVMTFGMNQILFAFSSTAVAVFNVYFKLQSFVFMPVFGLNNGMVPFLAVLSTLVFTVAGLTLAHPFIAVQTDIPDIVSSGTAYMRICGGLSFGLFLEIMFERLLQATGRTFYTMLTQGTGAIINIIMDPVLIFGLGPFPRMEVAGAAAATVLGQIVAAVLAVLFNLTCNHDIHPTLRGFRPNGPVIRNIYSVGAPSIILNSIGSVMTFGMNQILFAFSSTAVAVFNVYFKLQSFVFMPVFGLNNGMVPIVSYNYGARKRKRLVDTVKFSALLAVAIMLVGLVVIQLFPANILGLFEASPDMLDIGVPALRIISLCFVFAGFSIICSSTFQALGNGLLSMMISIVRQLLILLPAAFFLSLSGSVTAVWWAFPIAELASLALCVIFLRRIYRRVILPLE